MPSRFPLQEITNTNFNTNTNGQAYGTRRAHQVSQEGNEIPPAYHTSFQLPATDPDTYKLTTFVPAEENLNRTSNVDLQTCLCFLPLPTFLLGRGAGVTNLGQLTYRQMVSREIASNPCWVARYAESLYEALKEQEVQFRVKPDYLRGSKLITEQQRAGMMDAVVSCRFLQKTLLPLSIFLIYQRLYSCCLDRTTAWR